MFKQIVIREEKLLTNFVCYNLQIDKVGENEENSASQCKHDTIFNEEIGIYCRWCGWIHTEIKYITPPFVSTV